MCADEGGEVKPRLIPGEVGDVPDAAGIRAGWAGGVEGSELRSTSLPSGESGIGIVWTISSSFRKGLWSSKSAMVVYKWIE